MLRKTREIAGELGITAPTLLAAIARGKFAPPAKDASGDYIWTDEDLARARIGLAVDLRRRSILPISAGLQA